MSVYISDAAIIVTLIVMMTSAQAKQTPIITVRPDHTVVSPFMGLGVQWDPFQFQPTPKDWRIIVTRMNYCHPGYLRVMWMAQSYCKGFSLDGKPEYAWEKGFSSQRGELNKLCAILDFAQKRAIPVILGEWAPPIGLIQNETDPRWARITADLLEYLRNKRGYTCIIYYNVINEPNGDWSGNKDYPTWVSVVKSLHQELVKRRLADQVRIIGPDTTGNMGWREPFTWLDRAAKDLPAEIGAWDLHWYALDPEVYQDDIERLLTQKKLMLQHDGEDVASKPLFLGESGLLTGRVNGDQQPRVKTFDYGVMMADYVAQTARAGWMGALAWDLDDAMHSVKYQNPPGPLTLKIWGFWNSQADVMGDPSDFNIRPWFYTWSLMSRLFPKGSRIIYSSDPNIPRFRTVAGMRNIDGRERITIMLVNNDDISRTVLVRDPSLTGSVELTCYHYFQDDRRTNRNGFPIPYATLKEVDLNKGLEITLPTRGVIFLAETGGN